MTTRYIQLIVMGRSEVGPGHCWGRPGR